MNRLPEFRHHAWQNNKLAQKELNVSDLRSRILVPEARPSLGEIFRLEGLIPWIREIIRRVFFDDR